MQKRTKERIYYGFENPGWAIMEGLLNSRQLFTKAPVWIAQNVKFCSRTRIKQFKKSIEDCTDNKHGLRTWEKLRASRVIAPLKWHQKHGGIVAEHISMKKKNAYHMVFRILMSETSNSDFHAVSPHSWMRKTVRCQVFLHGLSGYGGAASTTVAAIPSRHLVFQLFCNIIS